MTKTRKQIAAENRVLRTRMGSARKRAPRARGVMPARNINSFRAVIPPSAVVKRLPSGGVEIRNAEILKILDPTTQLRETGLHTVCANQVALGLAPVIPVLIGAGCAALPWLKGLAGFFGRAIVKQFIAEYLPDVGAMTDGHVSMAFSADPTDVVPQDISTMSMRERFVRTPVYAGAKLAAPTNTRPLFIPSNDREMERVGIVSDASSAAEVRQEIPFQLELGMDAAAAAAGKGGSILGHYVVVLMNPNPSSSGAAPSADVWHEDAIYPGTAPEHSPIAAAYVIPELLDYVYQIPILPQNEWLTYVNWRVQSLPTSFTNLPVWQVTRTGAFKIVVTGDSYEKIQKFVFRRNGINSSINLTYDATSDGKFTSEPVLYSGRSGDFIIGTGADGSAPTGYQIDISARQLDWDGLTLSGPVSFQREECRAVYSAAGYATIVGANSVFVTDMLAGAVQPFAKTSASRLALPGSGVVAATFQADKDLTGVAVKLQVNGTLHSPDFEVWSGAIYFAHWIGATALTATYGIELQTNGVVAAVTSTIRVYWLHR